MIHETIKEVLGKDLAAQVEAALQGKGKDGKDIDIVVGNDGSYVPADKYDLLKQEKSTADQLAQSIRSELDSLKNSAGDIETMRADLKTAQDKAAELETNHQAEIARLRKGNSITLQVLGKAYDPADVLSAIDLDKVTLAEDGSISGGFDDQLTKLKETKPHWFKPDEDPDAGGGSGGTRGIPPTGGKPSLNANPWKKETFNLTEQGRLMRDDPARAAQLKAQAGAQ